jgi:hypothetical protein
MPVRGSDRRQRLFVVLACVLVPAVGVLSFLPYGDKSKLHTTGRFHSVGHFLAFIAIAFVVGRTSRSVGMRVILCLAVLVFGFGIEFVEHLMYQNAVEWTDVVVDCVGVLGGTLLAFASAPANG